MRALLMFALTALLVWCVAADFDFDPYFDADPWLKNKSKEPGVNRLPSGMLFKILIKGSGRKSPHVYDLCDVDYKGTLTSGEQFDSSYDRGQPATFAPNQVIKGWTEALQLMREGDKWEVYIPYNLAYGEAGRPPTIPAKATLVFEIELIEVKSGGRSGEQADRHLEAEVGKTIEQLVKESGAMSRSEVDQQLAEERLAEEQAEEEERAKHGLAEEQEEEQEERNQEPGGTGREL